MMTLATSPTEIHIFLLRRGLFQVLGMECAAAAASAIYRLRVEVYRPIWDRTRLTKISRAKFCFRGLQSKCLRCVQRIEWEARTESGLRYRSRFEHRSCPVPSGTTFSVSIRLIFATNIRRHCIESCPAEVGLCFRLYRLYSRLRCLFGPVTRSTSGRTLGHEAKAGITVSLS
jgi:hypothetical protein